MQIERIILSPGVIELRFCNNSHEIKLESLEGTPDPFQSLDNAALENPIFNPKDVL
jgi:hypothetical protein